MKEVDFYKKRVIFFKNKININLISKNINIRNSNNTMKKKLILENKNGLNDIFDNNSKSNSSKFKKIFKYISPSPIKHIDRKNNLCCLNRENNTSDLGRKKSLKKQYYSNLDYSNNENKNLITVNVDKFQKSYFEKDSENSSNKNLIEMNRNKSKENFFFPYNKNYFSIINNKNKINKEKITEDNLSINKNDELYSKKYTEEDLNIYFNDNKSNSEISNNNSYFKNLNSAIAFKRKRKLINNINKENDNNNKNLSKFSSSKDLSFLKNNIINKDYINKHSKNKTLKVFNSNINKKII